MKDLLLQIIGQYVTDTTAEGLAQVDFPWVLGAVLLIVCVYSVFRVIGLMFTSSIKG